MLTEIGSVTVDKDGEFSFADGSTRVFIQVVEFETFNVVQVYTPVLRQVPLTPSFYEYVALHADDYVFGNLALSKMEDGTGFLVFAYSILADYLDFEELHRAVGAVASTGDTIDDQLKAQFGGKRFMDP